MVPLLLTVADRELDRSHAAFGEEGRRRAPHATVQEHLGDVFARRGDFHKALDLYRTALTLEPEPKDEAKLRGKISELEQKQAAAQR